MVLGAAVVSGLLLVPAVGAGASSTGSAETQVADLEAQIRTGAARIHELTGAYSQAELQAVTLAEQVATEQGTLGRLRAQVSASRRTLEQVAVDSYTGEGVDGSIATVAKSVDPAVGDEYLSVASGDVSQTIDAVADEEAGVRTTLAGIRRDQAANARAVAAAAAARSQAIATAEAEQNQLQGLQSQLDSLIRANELTAPPQGSPVNGGLVTSTQNQTSPPSSAAGGTAGGSAGSTTTPTTAPPTTTAPTTGTGSTGDTGTGGGGAAGPWLALRECESGDNYAEDTGNGYYGAYQFSQATWSALGYPGRPDLEPPAMQDAAAQKLQAEAGWGQWPACSAALGLT